MLRTAAMPPKPSQSSPAWLWRKLLSFPDPEPSLCREVVEEKSSPSVPPHSSPGVNRGRCFSSSCACAEAVIRPTTGVAGGPCVKGWRDPTLFPAGDSRAGGSAACQANQIYQLVGLLLSLRMQPVFPLELSFDFQACSAVGTSLSWFHSLA